MKYLILFLCFVGVAAENAASRHQRSLGCSGCACLTMHCPVGDYSNANTMEESCNVSMTFFYCRATFMREGHCIDQGNLNSLNSLRDSLLDGCAPFGFTEDNPDTHMPFQNDTNDYPMYSTGYPYSTTWSPYVTTTWSPYTTYSSAMYPTTYSPYYGGMSTGYTDNYYTMTMTTTGGYPYWQYSTTTTGYPYNHYNTMTTAGYPHWYYSTMVTTPGYPYYYQTTYAPSYTTYYPHYASTTPHPYYGWSTPYHYATTTAYPYYGWSTPYHYATTTAYPYYGWSTPYHYLTTTSYPHWMTTTSYPHWSTETAYPHWSTTTAYPFYYSTQADDIGSCNTVDLQYCTHKLDTYGSCSAYVDYVTCLEGFIPSCPSLGAALGDVKQLLTSTCSTNSDNNYGNINLPANIDKNSLLAFLNSALQEARETVNEAEESVQSIEDVVDFIN